ncbi:hypothetical protein OKW43_008615 [Paraburkholderia sp. WC7.3g]|uniref:hypothetical protein n=1 Tax=Paraburkholderia sp. WC7.3g TaxID=2991070 RepID=UPI003D219667
MSKQPIDMTVAAEEKCIVVMPSVIHPGLSIADLLATHCSALDELRRRGVVRSGNNPTGDYAEWLVSSKLGLQLAAKSVKGFDATDANGTRYQIKARRVTADNSSTQLSVIRNLAGEDFDLLVAVVFDSAWNVAVAAKMTCEAVSKLATFRHHVNGHVMHLRRTVFSVAGVEDITALLRGEQ